MFQVPLAFSSRVNTEVQPSYNGMLLGEISIVKVEKNVYIPSHFQLQATNFSTYLHMLRN